MEDLISKVANLQFNNTIVTIVLLLIALYICFSGYTVYRVLLGFLGFYVGFSNVHKLIEFLNLEVNDKQMLALQIIFGAAFMMIAWLLRKVGIFIVVFDFVYVYLASIIVGFVAKKLEISENVYPYFSVLLALLLALIAALLTIKWEYSIAVIVMAWIGGFAAVHYLQVLVTDGPFNFSFIPPIPFWVWYFMQCFMSLLGMLKQGVGQDS